MNKVRIRIALNEREHAALTVVARLCGLPVDQYVCGRMRGNLPTVRGVLEQHNQKWPRLLAGGRRQVSVSVHQADKQAWTREAHEEGAFLAPYLRFRVYGYDRAALTRRPQRELSGDEPATLNWHILLSPEDHRLFSECARLAGTTKAGYFRAFMRGLSLPVVPDEARLVADQLRRTGVNLNQLLRALHSRDEVDPSLEDLIGVLAEVVVDVDEVRQRLLGDARRIEVQPRVGE